MLFSLLLLVGCSVIEEPPTVLNRVIISGRQDTRPLYQAMVPSSWIKLSDSSNKMDSREPIASWQTGSLLIQFHNFDPALRIHPMQQIERWKKQAGPNAKIEMTPTAHGGFGGYKFYALQSGLGTIAYAFQLNETLYKKLNGKEEGADWTVKVTGNKIDLELLANEIEEFVNSLELIEPIR